MAVVRIALWSLADSDVTVDGLRAEAMPRSEDASYEAWFSDQVSERWGSVAVFPDADAARAPLAGRVQELLQKDPDVVELFDLEQ